MQKKLFIICLFYFGGLFFSLLHAQKKNDFEDEKNSLSINVLGTGSYLGISYDRVLSDHLLAEIGIGVIGYGAGISFYPFKIVSNKKISPFIGLKYTNHAMVDSENKSATYFPFGFTYFSKKQVSVSIDIGPSYFNHKSPGYKPTPLELDQYPFTSFGIWGNIKLSFHFSTLKF